jgi:hypothetical protein
MMEGDGKRKKRIKRIKKTKKAKTKKGKKRTIRNTNLVNNVINIIVDQKKRRKRKKKAPSRLLKDSQINPTTERIINEYAKFQGYTQKETNTRRLRELKMEVEALEKKQKELVLKTLASEMVETKKQEKENSKETKKAIKQIKKADEIEKEVKKSIDKIEKPASVSQKELFKDKLDKLSIIPLRRRYVNGFLIEKDDWDDYGVRDLTKEEIINQLYRNLSVKEKVKILRSISLAEVKKAISSNLPFSTIVSSGKERKEEPKAPSTTEQPTEEQTGSNPNKIKELEPPKGLLDRFKTNPSILRLFRKWKKGEPWKNWHKLTRLKKITALQDFYFEIFKIKNLRNIPLKLRKLIADSMNAMLFEIDDIKGVFGKPEVTDSSDEESQDGGLMRLSKMIGEGGGLFDTQIEKVMKGTPNFSGVVAADEISKLSPKPNMNIIANTDPRGKSGTHWVAIKIDNKAKTVEYYDSFGRKPTKLIDSEIKELFGKLNTDDMYKYKYNGKVNQDVTTDTCGYFSMLFLLSRNKGNDFKQSTGFDEEDVEDRKLKGTFKFI